MAGVDSASSHLDPYVKPKPGKKVFVLCPVQWLMYCLSYMLLLRLFAVSQPKAALPDSLPVNSRPLSANSQSTGRTGFPPHPEKQNLVLCKYFEQGRDL